MFPEFIAISSAVFLCFSIYITVPDNKVHKVHSTMKNRSTSLLVVQVSEYIKRVAVCLDLLLLLLQLWLFGDDVLLVDDDGARVSHVHCSVQNRVCVLGAGTVVGNDVHCIKSICSIGPGLLRPQRDFEPELLVALDLVCAHPACVRVVVVLQPDEKQNAFATVHKVPHLTCNPWEKWYDASGSHVPSDVSVHSTFMHAYWMRNETEHILKLTELEKRINAFVWKVDPRIFRQQDVYMAAYWHNSKSRQEEKDAVRTIKLMIQLRRDMGDKPDHDRVLADACALYDAQIAAAAAL